MTYSIDMHIYLGNFNDIRDNMGYHDAMENVIEHEESVRLVENLAEKSRLTTLGPVVVAESQTAIRYMPNKTFELLRTSTDIRVIAALKTNPAAQERIKSKT